MLAFFNIDVPSTHKKNDNLLICRVVTLCLVVGFVVTLAVPVGYLQDLLSTICVGLHNPFRHPVMLILERPLAVNPLASHSLDAGALYPCYTLRRFVWSRSLLSCCSP